ncbi:MAG: NUDIX domain-containing protein [Burkholderiaceae bacterium]|nr:NUDIX domain-containing protein [Burkholderiaceae bacterium]
MAVVDLLEKALLHRGFFRLERVRLRHERFAGGMSPALDREVVSRGDIVAVLPYDPRRDEVVLVEQFRVGPYLAAEPAWLREIVAGLVEPGESPAEAAVRETREEIGAEIARLDKIGSYFLAPHQSPDRVHLFLGEVDASLASEYAGLADEGEDIRVLRMARPQAVSSAVAGEIRSPWTLSALLWLDAWRLRQISLGFEPREANPPPPTPDPSAAKLP